MVLSDDYQVEHGQGPHLTLKKSLPAASGLGNQTSNISLIKEVSWGPNLQIFPPETYPGRTI